MAGRKRVPGLGARGAALYDELKGRFVDDAAGMLLLTEACRLADRLDGLHEAIAGRGVVELMRFRRTLGSGDGSDGDPVLIEVHFDKVLAEARQQQNTLRLLLGQICPPEAEPMAGADQPEPGEQKPGVPSVADIRARRAARTGGSSPAR